MKIPEHWKSIELKNIVLSQKGKKPQILKPDRFKNSVPYLDIRAIEFEEISYYADSLSSFISDSNDIFIVADGSRSGWVGISSFQGAIASTIIALTPVRINQDFLYYFLKTKFNYLNINAVGVSIPHVDKELLFELPIPLPPPIEQNQIVEEIEKYYFQINSLRNHIAKRKKQLAEIKRLILEWAVTGELSRNWRNKNLTSNSYIDLKKQVIKCNSENNVEQIELIFKQYRTAQFGIKIPALIACSAIQNGSTPKLFVSKGERTIPYFKVYNIVNDKIDFSKDQYISDSIHTNELKKSIVRTHDILINIVGPPLGKVAYVTDEYPESNINQALTFFRTNEFLIPKFLFYIFKQGKPINEIMPFTKGNAGQVNISLTQCREFEFLIPPLEEQKEIVRLIEKYTSIADDFESYFDSISEKIDVVETLMLEAAYTGKLSMRVESDISVSEILKQIEIEKLEYENQRNLLKKQKSIMINTKKDMGEKNIQSIIKEHFEGKAFSFDELKNLMQIEDYDKFQEDFFELIREPLKISEQSSPLLEQHFDKENKCILFKEIK